MEVYHGSYVKIVNPDIELSRSRVDFGKGFYVTPFKEQAQSWSKRFEKRKQKGIVSIYEMDIEKCKAKYAVLEFTSHSEEWIDFVTACRMEQDDSKYDIVIGGVANDKVFNTIELYLEKLIDKKEAIKRLSYEKPNLQICIRNQEVLDNYLQFLESEEV